MKIVSVTTDGVVIENDVNQKKSDANTEKINGRHENRKEYLIRCTLESYKRQVPTIDIAL